MKKNVINIYSKKILKYLKIELLKKFSEINNIDLILDISYLENKIVPKFIDYLLEKEKNNIDISTAFLWDKIEIYNKKTNMMEEWYFKNSYYINIIFNTTYFNIPNIFKIKENDNFYIFNKQPVISLSKTLNFSNNIFLKKYEEYVNINKDISFKYIFKFDSLLFNKTFKHTILNNSLFNNLISYSESLFNDYGYRLILIFENEVNNEKIIDYFNEYNFMFKYVYIMTKNDFLNLTEDEKKLIFTKKIPFKKENDYKIIQKLSHKNMKTFYENTPIKKIVNGCLKELNLEQ